MGLELSDYGDRLYDMDRLPEMDSKGKLLFLVTDAMVDNIYNLFGRNAKFTLVWLYDRSRSPFKFSF